MLVSTKGRYALRVMIDLAEHRSDGRTPLRKIAAARGSPRIPREHPHDVGAPWVAVWVARQGGGYCLTREPEDFTIGEVLRLTEGSLCPVACLEHGHDGCDARNTVGPSVCGASSIP